MKKQLFLVKGKSPLIININQNWLKSLTRKLPLERLKQLAAEYQRLRNKYWKSCVESIVDVISQANFDLIEKWKEDALMNAAVAKLFQPEVDNLKMLLEQERRAREQERQEREQERQAEKRERQERERERQAEKQERQERERERQAEKRERQALLEEVKRLKQELEKKS